MQGLGAFLALCALAAPLAEAQVIRMGVKKDAWSLPRLHKRASYPQQLNNNLTGGGYYADVAVGTPPQNVSLILDTGSSDVWVVANNANLCTSAALQRKYGEGCSKTFDSTKSSSYSVVSRGTFNIQYLDGSGATGSYIKDNFYIGGGTIKSLQMGLADNTTIGSGLMGIGFSSSVAAAQAYPNVVDEFVNQGLIAKKVYSLYLNDLFSSTGSILFGGLDTEKWVGTLKAVSILKDRNGGYSQFVVALTSFGTTLSGTFTNYTTAAFPVVLDSGTTLTYLPESITRRLYSALKAVDDTSSTGVVFVDCGLAGQNLTFDFQLGGVAGPVIHVPIDEMVLNNLQDYVNSGLRLPPNLGFSNVCSLGIQPNDGTYLLGDTFLRSAYVVYDLDDHQIALAPANLNSTTSNIIEVQKSDTGIPQASGVVSQVSITQTATGNPGRGGASSALPTVTVTASPVASSSTAAAVRNTVPPFNLEALAVASIAGLGFLLGGLLITI